MNQVKKVKHLRLAFTVCGVALALGAGSAFVINATNSSTVHAAEVQLDANSDFARLAPTTVNYTVHKGMTLLGKTQASVVDDGNAQSWNNDTTDFDPAKYGKVGYTAYDITNTIESGDMTDAGLKAIGDDIAKDPTGNYYIKNAQTKTAEQFITSGSITTFKNLAASDDNSEHHVWAIIETTHPKARHSDLTANHCCPATDEYGGDSMANRIQWVS
ncbi:pilin N-terminal domain-containing protein [Lacticaseibacillus manihotivorans]|uniref:pilin N-terminal domain-containing protein n=1 Tax=Lacticaseibacillus manihotivorans TaxID=88233 RepID=UPI000B053807|nr:pilin N-terminal domain-containing protein [Lacticaseibacillus manihotivorans]